MRIYFSAIIFCLITSSAFAEPLKIDSIMTKEEQKKMGIDKLTPQQKTNLEAWIGNWTKKTLDQSPTYYPALSLSQWINQWPLGANPLKKATPEQIAKQQKTINRRIDTISDDGAIINLKDGSVWKVIDTDTFRSKTWHRGDTLTWEESGAAIPPYFLTNLSEGTTELQVVGASMVQPPSPSGIKAPTPKETYANSDTIAKVFLSGPDGYYGVLIQLANGTKWSIAPIDQAVAANWRVGDRVRAENSGDYQYPFLLSNLDSGATAKAIRQDRSYEPQLYQPQLPKR